ncbi:WzxE protein [Klebsiella michiganensis]|uniref:WzxE protein n=1 Tax=Klebsiella michiganensis TaxID=1134687 RepID=A0A7H4M2L1_9ENTR|nr:WzxE protein [Klebsiella michiganensis]
MSFGPAGVGQAGNFRQLVTVLGVLAGAGIFNGVTKLVAQHHDDRRQLNNVVGTASAMVLGFSTLLALIFLLAAAPISQGLFVINITRIWYGWWRWCRWGLPGRISC